jgi:pyruvate/2-oxoglutarate dehydrogenase complex dihydrolipoamide acyltransferase (E2) component
MASEVKLPRLGQGMESGTIVRWLKTEGDAVTKGEPLYELDTDKVTQEVEAESDGVLLKIVVADGEVDVGTTVGIIGAQDEDVSALLADAQGGNGGAPPATAAPAAAPVPTADAPVEEAVEPSAPTDTVSQVPDAEVGSAQAPTPARAPGERVKAPARAADRASVGSTWRIVGTDPEGRVIAGRHREGRDPPACRGGGRRAAAGIEIVELTSTRKTIARLTEAWAAPVFQLTVNVDANELVATRQRMVVAAQEGETKPTVSDAHATRLGARPASRRECELRRGKGPPVFRGERRARRRRAERPHRPRHPRCRPQVGAGDRS